MSRRSSAGTVGVALAAVILVVGGFVALLVFSRTKSTTDTRTTAEVALSCTTDMATQYHVHSELSMVIDGVAQTVPAEIGVTRGCMRPLHTHDADGVIHIESPVKRDFTLGDFFLVWGQSMDKEGYRLIVTAYGATVADPSAMVLEDDLKIIMTYVKDELQD